MVIQLTTNNFYYLFEHSYSKKKEMLALVKKYFPKGKVEVIKDLNGKDRFTIVVNN